MRFAHQLFLAVDQFFNVLAAGYADETLSARAYRSARRDGGGRWVVTRRVIDALFVWQDWLVKRRGEWTGARHCERAWMAEIERRQYPPEYRGGDA